MCVLDSWVKGKKKKAYQSAYIFYCVPECEQICAQRKTNAVHCVRIFPGTHDEHGFLNRRHVKNDADAYIRRNKKRRRYVRPPRWPMTTLIQWGKTA